VQLGVTGYQPALGIEYKRLVPWSCFVGSMNYHAALNEDPVPPGKIGKKVCGRPVGQFGR
jgi:hypothetical protein